MFYYNLKNFVFKFTEFVLIPLTLLFSLFILIACLTVVAKTSFSEKVKYSDVGVIENKEFKVEKNTDSEGGVYSINRYYVTISYKGYTRTLDNPTFYSSVQVGEEIKIYVVEFWYKKELYRIDFHYKENRAGKFSNY